MFENELDVWEFVKEHPCFLLMLSQGFYWVKLLCSLQNCQWRYIKCYHQCKINSNLHLPGLVVQVRFKSMVWMRQVFSRICTDACKKSNLHWIINLCSIVCINFKDIFKFFEEFFRSNGHFSFWLSLQLEYLDLQCSVSAY